MLSIGYRRTAIIIFPRHSEGRAVRRDPLLYSLERISDKLSRGWKLKDAQSKHVNAVLQLLNDQSKESVRKVLNILCQAAIQSKDASLWMRAIRDCGAILDPDLLAVPAFIEGIDIFGFDAVKLM